MAKGRFYLMKRRMQCSLNLRKEYINFMQEYINLGHMEEDPTSNQAHQQDVSLPHHGTVNANSETTNSE